MTFAFSTKSPLLAAAFGVFIFEVIGPATSVNIQSELFFCLVLQLFIEAILKIWCRIAFLCEWFGLLWGNVHIITWNYELSTSWLGVPEQ